MKAYSLDLRSRVVTAATDGQSHHDVARRFAVGRSTVDRWVARHVTEGTVAPKPSPGRPRAIGPADEPALLAQVETWPDATLAEHCKRWATMHGVQVSVPTMCRAILCLGWTRKKKVLRESERDEDALSAWLEVARALDV